MHLPNIFEKNTAAVDFPPGATVFTAGESGRHLYLVRAGEVDLRVGGRVVETVGPEGFFGEMALLDDGPRSADAVARTACTLVPVDQKQFLFMVAETPFFALVLLRTLSRRLRRADAAVTTTTSLRGAPRALALAALLAVAVSPGTAAGQDLVVDAADGNSPYAVTADGSFANVTAGDTSTGTINHSAGTLTVSNTVVLGNAAGASGTYNLSAAGVLMAAQSIVGRQGTGLFNQTGGAQTVAGTLYLGFPGGTSTAATGNGTFDLSGGTLATGATQLGNYGTGTFNQTGGTHTIASALYVGLNGGTGLYTLSAGGLSAPGNITVGYSGTGTFTQGGGSASTGNAGTVFVGELAGGNGTVNLNGGTLTTNRVLAGAGTGTFNFNGGTLRAGASDSPGGGRGSYTFFTGVPTVNVRNGGATVDTNGFNVTVAQNLAHSGIAGDAAIDGGLTKTGAGTLTLSALNGYRGPTTVTAGTLAVTGAGAIANTRGITVDNGGALTLAGPGGITVNVLQNTGFGQPVLIGPNGAGTVTQSGGTFTVTATSNGVELGSNAGGNGTFNLQGGTLSTQNVTVGVQGAGTFNQSGGTFTTGSNAILVLGEGPGGNGTYNLSGGSLATGSFTLVSDDANTSVFTQSGGTHTTPTLILAGDSTAANGTYNLNGGTLTTTQVVAGRRGQVGTATFNFNGGTLRAGASDATFLQGLSAANVRAGGAIIDTNGFNVTVAQPLVHSPIANDAATDGGLTKNGAGALTVTGANTYTGRTAVNGGALFVNNAAGSGTGGGAVYVAPNGTWLGGTGTIGGNVTVGAAAPSPAAGSVLNELATPGAVQPHTVAGNATLAPGATGPGAAGVLTINGSLTFTNAVFLELDLGGANPGANGYDQVRVGGALTLGNASLSLALASGFTPTLGERFFILDDLGLTLTSGAFGNVTALGATTGQFTDANGNSFLVNYADHDPADASNLLPNDVSLTYLGANVPEPSTWALLLAAGAGALGGRRRLLTRRRQA